jgi:hypothetical protein
MPESHQNTHIVFVNRVLRRICGAKQEEVTGIMRSLISSTVNWILKEEGMDWSCGMDRKQEICMHFSQKT